MPVAVLVPLIAAGATSAASIYGASRAAGSADKGAKLQSDAAMRAAQLEADANAQALAFAREQEAERRRQFEATQGRNYEIYQDERNYGRRRDAERDERLKPYVNVGQGTIRSLMQPIPRRTSGTVGDLFR